MPSSPAVVRERLAVVLRRLSLCSTVAARCAFMGVSSPKPGSAPPVGERSVAESYAHAAEAAGDDVERLSAILAAASDELAQLLRRPLPDVRSETLADLQARIVGEGEGFAAQEVAICLRTSVTLVRKARLCAGRDAEWGRSVNGDGDAGALLAAGLSMRAVAAITGTPRSTLQYRLSRRS